MADKTLIAQADNRPEPVSPEAPLVGLERDVLKVWLQESPALRKAHQALRTRRTVEQAVRLAVFEAHAAELDLRATGLTPEEAQEFTRPRMWTPPTNLRPRRSTPPAPGAKPRATSSSTTPAR